MSNPIKKIVFVLSLVLLYLTVKEFLQLYSYLSDISTLFALVIMVILFSVVVYFGVLPVFQILILPTSLGPTKERHKTNSVLQKRIKKLRTNQYLRNINFDFSEIKYNHQSYEKMIEAIKPESQRIRKKHINSVFYGTAISQNGFLDAIMIFSASVRMVKEIFILYNGRTNSRDLILIWKNIYYSIVIGGSDGVEYATEEVFSKLATDSMKSIPFISKILSSLTDGFVNAVLLTRISLITEKYCTKLYIKKQRELFPHSVFVIETAKDLTKDIFARIKDSMISITKDKTESIFKRAVNPVTLVLDRGYQTIKRNNTTKYVENIWSKKFSRIKIFMKN